MHIVIGRGGRLPGPRDNILLNCHKLLLGSGKIGLDTFTRGHDLFASLAGGCSQQILGITYHRTPGEGSHDQRIRKH